MTHNDFVKWVKEFGSTDLMAQKLGVSQRYVQMILRGDRNISPAIELKYLKRKK